MCDLVFSGMIHLLLWLGFAVVTSTDTATGGMTKPAFIICCFRLEGGMGNRGNDELLSSGGGGGTVLLFSLSDLRFLLLVFAVALSSILLTV